MNIAKSVKDTYQDQISKSEYGALSYDIWKCDDIQSQLKEGWEIMKAVKEKVWKNHPLYQQFDKEYKELYETIKASYQSEKSFSQVERSKILLELSDMIHLAEKEWIIEKKGHFSWWWDVLKKTNTQEAKNQALSFRSKKVQEYSQDEAIAAMEYLSYNYKKYKEVTDDKVTKWITFMYSTVADLDDQYEVRLFQEELMKKIFTNGKQFNEKYLLWFNAEKGNYITSIWDFENYLRNPNTKMSGDEKDANVVNSRALANYFSYLEGAGKLNMWYVKTVLSSVQLTELQKLWQLNPNSMAQKIFSEQSESKNPLLKNFFSYSEKYNEKITLSNYKQELTSAPQKVFLVNDKSLLLKIISEVPNIKYTDIDFNLKHDIDVIEAISRRDQTFKISMIPPSFYDIKITNQSDIEKIKRVMKITNTSEDFLMIMWDISVYLEENDIKILLKNIEGQDARSQSIQQYLSKLSVITKTDFDNAFQNIINSSWKSQSFIEKQLVDINLYVYKNWIVGIEEPLLQILDKKSLENFPGIQKHLHANVWFVEKIISKYPDYFDVLWQKLQSEAAVVWAYLDALIQQWFDYKKIIHAINSINFWDNIWVILLIHSKLSLAYSKQRVKNIFWHPYITQKFFVFTKSLENKEYWEAQLKVLTKIDDIFWELGEEYTKAWEVIAQVNQAYVNFESKNKDTIFLQKISQITWFDWENKEINQKILDIVKKGKSVQNDRELYGLLQKWTWWDAEKVAKIFQQLQAIKKEKLQEEIRVESKNLSDIQLSSEDITLIIAENKKQKGETEEQYQARIFDIIKNQKNILLTPEKEQSIKNIIQKLTEVEQIIFEQANADLYLEYLKNPNAWDNFQDFAQYVKEQKEWEVSWVLLQKTWVVNGIDYIKSGNGNYLIETHIWKIELTAPEWKMVSHNKEAYNNLVHFKQTLQELNLDGLWKYRDSIFTAISWKYVGIFDASWDYINQNEMKIFISAVLSAIWISLNSQVNLNDFKQQVKQINKVWIIWWQQSVSVFWDGFLENLFIQRFDSKRTGIIHPHVLQKEIWNLFWQSV